MSTTFKQRLSEYKISPHLTNFENVACSALEQAIISVEENNFGVGAAIATLDGKILITGRNHVFYPSINSSLHAEMDAITQFEQSTHYEQYKPEELMLITTLEPCVMCFGRILLSPTINHIYWLSDDTYGGASCLESHLPDVFRALKNKKVLQAADCGNHLKQLAQDIFLHNREALCNELGIQDK